VKNGLCSAEDEYFSIRNADFPIRYVIADEGMG